MKVANKRKVALDKKYCCDKDSEFTEKNKWTKEFGYQTSGWYRSQISR